MIRFADGFDAYGADTSQMTDGLWAAISSVTLETAIKRTGARSMFLDSAASSTRRVFGASLAQVGIAQAIYPVNLPSTPHAAPLVQFNDSNNFPQCTLNLDTTGVLSLWRGDDANAYGTQLAVTTAAMTAASWQHLEVKADFAGNTFEVRLNSVTIMNASAVNLVNSNPSSGRATGQVSAAQVMFRNATSGHGSRYMDDLVVWDTATALNNDFVGDVKVFTDMPNADTADVAWTPNSGANRWSRISEIPADGDVTYDEAIVNGDRMGVTFPALDAAIVEVKALIFIAKTRKTDAGLCNLTVSAHSGASETAGADNAITTQYTYRLDVFQTDPATAAPGVPAAAGAAAMVLERTA
jgi:hypothetical protein